MRSPYQKKKVISKGRWSQLKDNLHEPRTISYGQSNSFYLHPAGTDRYYNGMETMSFEFCFQHLLDYICHFYIYSTGRHHHIQNCIQYTRSVNCYDSLSSFWWTLFATNIANNFFRQSIQTMQSLKSWYL